jgi:Ser/Thr protein kinase RdoA (MazF antagonist)
MRSTEDSRVALALFDLPEAVLNEALRTSCPDAVRWSLVSSTSRTGTEGICGEYQHAIFTVTTGNGSRRDVLIFARRQLRPSDKTRQAHHYAHLSSQGVPLPRLYASTVDPEGREVLLLERIDELHGSDAALLGEAGYLREFLELAASLAAVPLDIGYVGQIGHDVAGRDFLLNWADWLPWSVHILSRIESGLAAGIFGPGLRDYCCRNPEAIDRLKRICLPLMRAVRSLPLGLVHGDLRPGNTGRSRTDGRLVLFDLEDLCIDTRFFDVGQVLGGPKCPVSGWANAELAELFLDAFRKRSGQDIDLQTFLNEARIAWAARKMNLWELLPPSAGGPPYDRRAFISDEHERAERLRELFSQLVESLEALGAAIQMTRSGA